MKYKALVSAHMYLVEGTLEVEILSQIDNDKDYNEIFSDIDHALLDQIEPVLNEDNRYDYYFMALVESEFTECFNGEYIDYDIEHNVTEIKTIEDLNLTQI